MNPMHAIDTGSDDARPVLSPGQMLKAAREARGLHLAVLSVTLKVPVRQLEALENDCYDVFTGPTFLRAVAQSVCRQLGMDPAPVLSGLPSIQGSLPLPAPALDTSSKPPAQSWSAAGQPLVTRQVLFLAVLMLLATAAFIWWPQIPERLRQTAEQPAASAASEVLPELATAVNVPSVPASEASAIIPAGVGASTPAPAASAAVDSGARTPRPAASAVSVGSASPAQMLISATGDTWLEVRDAQGQLVINRLLQAGDAVPLNLPPPFNVVLGRAYAARVVLNGKDFDLTPFTKVTTARFDIQP